MADVATPGQDLIAAAAGDCSAAQDAAPAQQEDEVVDESDAKLPAPLNNGAYRKILKELPDGPRIAAETCVQFWKDKKFPTEELVAFLKTISVHSPSLKKGFDDQHNGFLRAMKLQEEQQRKREEEEMARRHEAPWMPNTHYPAHLMMESMMAARAMYMGGMHPHDMSRYSAVLARTYNLPHDGLLGGMGEYGHDRSAIIHPYDPQYMRGAMRRDAMGMPMPSPSMQRGGGYHGAHRGAGMPGAYASDIAAGRPGKRSRGEHLEEDAMGGLPADAQHRRLPASSTSSSSAATFPAHVPPVTDADLAAARTALKGKYPRDLINDALGTWLTERAQVVTSAVFVKVIANVRRRIRDHGGAARQDGGAAAAPGDFAAAEGGDGEGGEGARRASHDAESGGGDLDGGGKQETGYYRSKAILAFRCLPGSVGDALTFGMYVHEYGVEAPAAFRGKVLLECIDGTPLFNGETADERQRCLSAIAQGYMDFVASEGFAQLLIRVPPPTDTHAHLFSPRSGDVQLKASQHLSQWYGRLIEYGMRIGTVCDYRSSPNGSGIGFPLSVLSARDCAAEESFKSVCEKLDSSEGEGGHHYCHIARADRYFVADLQQSDDALGGLGEEGKSNLGRDLPIVVCPLAANRQRLTSFCGQNCLMFHTIEHAQYSTMILLKEFLHQRQIPHGTPPGEDELDEEWEKQIQSQDEDARHESNVEPATEHALAHSMLEQEAYSSMSLDASPSFSLPLGLGDPEKPPAAKRLHSQTGDEGQRADGREEAARVKLEAPDALSASSPAEGSYEL